MAGLWKADTCGPWHAARDAYPDVAAAYGSARLAELDRWRRDGLPGRIAGRALPHVTLEELVWVTEWKMLRGVWRARNLQLVRGNPPEAVERLSAAALAAVPDPKRPVALLAKLGGVGPATASAVLATVAPAVYPFFDEVVAAQMPGLGPVAFTAAYYQRYAAALRSGPRRYRLRVLIVPGRHMTSIWRCGWRSVGSRPCRTASGRAASAGGQGEESAIPASQHTASRARIRSGFSHARHRNDSLAPRIPEGWTAVQRPILPEPDRAIPTQLDLPHTRTCECPPNHLNCLTPKEWLKAQLGVWQFYYEGRDIRDKALHPATYPIALAARCIELFTHQGELVLDPFVGSGTTLVAAQDLRRNAVGFDLNPQYIELSRSRLRQPEIAGNTQQRAIAADARNIPRYLAEESVALIVTSPPYANLLNRERRNKSRRGDERRNEQYEKIEQYSQDSRDLGILVLEDYQREMRAIFEGLLPFLRPKGHCVINVPDMWWENERITIHIAVVEALRAAGYELRNTIIWDRTNIVNRVGIFGWPNNYITMGVTFEYLLDFWRPPQPG